ncbi:MAG: redoxin domain-containing protein [Cyanobacteria bacterium P01_H01_bin.74]
MLAAKALYPVFPISPGLPGPDFSLLSTTGKTMTLASCLKENGAILAFFASHCFSADQKKLLQLKADYSRQLAGGVAIVGISALNWETLYELRQTLDLPYPLLFDSCCRVSKQYRAILIPKFVTGRKLIALNASGLVTDIASF